MRARRHSSHTLSALCAPAARHHRPSHVPASRPLATAAAAGEHRTHHARCRGGQSGHPLAAPVAEHALRDYAGFVAWSYEQHLARAVLSGAQEALGAVNHGDHLHPIRPCRTASMLPTICRWTSAATATARGRSESLGLLRLGAREDTLGVAINTHPDPTEGWEVDGRCRLEHGQPIADVHARRAPLDQRHHLATRCAHGREMSRLPFLIATHDSVARLLIYTLMPTRGATRWSMARSTRARTWRACWPK